MSNAHLIRAAAASAAAHPDLQASIAAVLQREIPNLVQSALADMAAGCFVYVSPKAHRRGERNRRIKGDAQAGVHLQVIASREGLTLRQVQRIVSARDIAPM